MPKSKNRKNHKQKVQQRKLKLANMKKQYQKFYNDFFTKQLDTLKEQYEQMSGNTENNEKTEQ
jgi:hypothetical protein